MPAPYHPQSLNRYSYVSNNPLRYTDPTGHMRVEEAGSKRGCSDPKYCQNGKPKPSKPNKDKGKDTGGSGTPKLMPVPNNAPSSSLGGYCGGGSNVSYNILDCGANITQDAALAIDTVFGGIEAVLITAGCFAGPEGCGAGLAVGNMVFNVTGANAFETLLSFVSMGFSIGADYYDDGHFGESSGIAAGTALVGALSPDPIIDFVIDGFAAGYNHNVKPISNIPPLIGSLFNH